MCYFAKSLSMRADPRHPRLNFILLHHHESSIETLGPSLYVTPRRRVPEANCDWDICPTWSRFSKLLGRIVPGAFQNLIHVPPKGTWVETNRPSAQMPRSLQLSQPCGNSRELSTPVPNYSSPRGNRFACGLFRPGLTGIMAPLEFGGLARNGAIPIVRVEPPIRVGPASEHSVPVHEGLDGHWTVVVCPDHWAIGQIH